ncbi:MAG: histidine phosphatase family protein [Candidatus Gracilibacteria bacterium]|nr:histidine phosphatase family protein [Candidatus Gracilibacteria bacterium]
MLKIYIARHGETLENKAGIVQGHMDGTLSQDGIFQANKLGEHLKDIWFDHIYCSDLGRAKDTLSEILKYVSCPDIVYTQGLRERDVGDSTGKLFSEIDMNVEKGAETNISLKERSGKFLEEIKSSHDSGTILFLTHGGYIKWLFSYIKDIADENMKGRYSTNNCSLSLIESDGGDFKEIFFNDIGHLS